MPTLVLTGAEDGHNDTAEALADGRYIMLPGNHGTAIAAPQFEIAVNDFLEGGRAASPRAEPEG